MQAPGFKVCPHCGTEFEGRVMKCSKCEYVYHTGPEIVDPSVSRSVLAVAYSALVLGVLGVIGLIVLVVWLTLFQKSTTAANPSTPAASTSGSRPG